MRYETPELVEFGSINEVTFAVQGELTGMSSPLPQEEIPPEFQEVTDWEEKRGDLGWWWK